MTNATFATALGPVTVDASADAVARIHLHPRHATVPTTSGRNGPAWLAHLGERIARHLEGDIQDFSGVPLDLSATSQFSQQVYLECRRVAAGTTISYKGLAHRVGRPQGARAVARTMATNPVPIVIPCHRVVASSGALTGYSGGDGPLTKALLLAREGVLPDLTGGKTRCLPACWRWGGKNARYPVLAIIPSPAWCRPSVISSWQEPLRPRFLIESRRPSVVSLRWTGFRQRLMLR